MPNCALVYQDDFYLPDSEIPVDSATGLEDWDCPEAFDLSFMSEVIKTVKETGEFPSTFQSKEETNTLGKSNVSEEQLSHIKKKIESVPGINDTFFVIVDGIMLYHDPKRFLPDLDLAILLRAPYETLKKRREARNGYVTLDGFWEDPPGYFDKIVWPGYVKTHGYLFEKNSTPTTENEDDQAKARLDRAPLTKVAKEEYQINTPIKLDSNNFEVLDWATDLIKAIN